MKKLKLDLETLRIEAFDVEPRVKEDEGTVYGHSTGIGSFTEPYRYCLNQPATRSCGC